jgi:hypothetical protein
MREKEVHLHLEAKIGDFDKSLILVWFSRNLSIIKRVLQFHVLKSDLFFRSAFDSVLSQFCHSRFLCLGFGLVQFGGHRLRWVSATEWQIRKVVHFHLVIVGDGLRNVSRKRWEFRWESLRRFTGFVRIYDADFHLKRLSTLPSTQVSLSVANWFGEVTGEDLEPRILCDAVASPVR